MSEIILASASPRRRDLLLQIGLDFEVVCSDAQEIIEENISPEKIAEKLAYQKALNVAEKFPEKIVIGADTIVVNDSTILGKPHSKKEAYLMLSSLSGSRHQVITGVAVIKKNRDKALVRHKITDVYFKKLSDREILDYIDSKEPFDKAGAYGIQGLGACLVEKINGCYFNVVGLPLQLLVGMLREFGIYVLGGENA